MRKRSVAVLTFSAAVTGCSGSGSSNMFTVEDAATDDASDSGSVLDARDARIETGIDAGLEASTDASMEASADAGVDAACGMDTGMDSSMDSSMDVTQNEADGNTADGGDGSVSPIAATKRVLLISIDGMHQVDLANWISGHPTSTLANLAGTGVEYTAANTTTPSDSFPGTVGLVTGGTPRSTGVYYDDSYDRTLYAPGPKGCGPVPGTEIVFDESIDVDDTLLFSGGIDESNLPWAKDSAGNCNHVHPHDFLRVNTIFEVIKFAGYYTAWSDKHPAYEILSGPSGEGIDDLYTPEIASDPHKAPMGLVNGVDLHAALDMCDGTTNSLPTANLTDYTTCGPIVMAYDDTKVQAILNEIDGKSSDGSGARPVPTVFGMNFQTVSVTEKLPVGGYTDATGTPSKLLAAGLAHVDQAIGKMVAELTTQGLVDSTLIVVTAKHGQSPIDKTKLSMEKGAKYATTAMVQDPSAFIIGVDSLFARPSTFRNPNSQGTYDTNGHLTTDDVGIVWIQHSSDITSTKTIASALEHNAAAMFADTLPQGTIFTTSITSGSALATIYGDPNSVDPVASARAPDIFIQPNWGTIYSGSSSKIAEHGGGTTDDTNVALLVSLSGLGSAKMVSTPVSTTQVAPTILRALGLDPTRLEAVMAEGTQVLPGIF